MDKEKTGELIRQARMEKGLTQSELGDLIGVTNKAVSRWERGESFPDIALLDHLAECLSLQIEDLVLGERQVVLEKYAMPDEREDEMEYRPFEYILRELVQELRLQRKDWARKYRSIIFYVVIMIILVVWGIGCLNGSANEWFAILTGYSKEWMNMVNLGLFGVVLVLTFVTILKSNSANVHETSNKSHPIIWWITVGSILYIMVLMIGFVLITLYSPAWLNVVHLSNEPETLVGGWIHDSLAVIYIVQMACIVYYFSMLIRQNSGSLCNLCLSEGVVFLTLIYSNIQHMLTDDVWKVLYMIVGYTAGVFIIGGVAILGRRIVENKE